ncbi:hypothetical protein [Streptomyces sp. V1I1]|uniref:hypothetical protein n=1 Tax=Streptomyces sp. V1I1 TaxID=3042272 RepID=UPI00278643C9|nr:hypothetical protein [Streptomyces sp. V1I1]MDQ0942620.1 hypothetical protein [Streptomyces sp. V1I1]
MHHHGYLWTGPKQRFDQEGLRRPPHPEPPPVGSKPELIQRYRDVVTDFPVCDLPPLETAHWLMKPRTLLQGTWEEPKRAAEWLDERLAEYAPRFASESDREATRLAALINSAAERLGWGGDLSIGFYLEQPAFLTMTLVTCSPNRTSPDLQCPAC